MRWRVLKSALPVALSALIAALFAWGTIRLTVPRLVGVEVRRDIPAEILSPLAPAHVVRASLGGVDPYAFYSNLRSQRQYWITDPTEAGGAKVDGVTDDSAAIMAADADAAAHGGAVYFVPGVTATTAELAASQGARWRCLGAYGACGVKATASVTSLIRGSSTSALTPLGQPGTPTTIEGLALDGNSLALYGFRGTGWRFSTLSHNLIKNVLLDPIHISGQDSAVTLSAVTPSGGGVGGAVTLSLPDAFYSGFISATTNNAIKIIDPGGFGTATYSLSTDGGASYGIFKQFVFAKSHPCVPSGNNCVIDSGIEATFTSRTYASGEIYSWTTTHNSVLVGGALAAPENLFEENEAYNSGIAYAHGSVMGPYLGTIAGTINAPGTIDATFTTQVITGHSTTFLTGAASPALEPRPGDLIYPAGTQLLILACALDDTHLAYSTTFSYQFAVTGVDWGIGCGAGYHEPHEGDVAQNRWVGGHISGVPTSLFLAGTTSGGTSVDHGRYEGFVSAGIVWGGLLNSPGQALAVRPQLSQATVGGSKKIVIRGGTNVTIIEPQQQIDLTPGNDIVGDGFADVKLSGSEFAKGGNSVHTSVPIQADMHMVTPVTVSSSSQVLPVANLLVGSNTSLLYITASSPITLTSATPVDHPWNSGILFQDGIQARIVNIGSSAITFPSTGNDLDMTADVTLGQFQELDLTSRGNRWTGTTFQSGVVGGVSSVTGTSGVYCSPTTGAVSCSNTGVTSVTASGAGITASPTTGAVVVANTGVTSNVAGTGISVSGATGAVTVSLVTPVSAANGGNGVSSPTAHAVEIAEGASAIGLAGPNAAFQIPFISQGSSSDPIFGTCGVPGGCTGQTSFNAHSVLLGNSTGALNSTAANPASASVLTGQGAADPIFVPVISGYAALSSAGAGTAVGNAVYTDVLTVTVTVPSGAVMLVRGTLGCIQSGTTSAFQFGIGVDAVGPTSVQQGMTGSVGTVAAGALVNGAVDYRATGLSNASHTFHLVAEGIGAGGSCGGTLLVQSSQG